MQQIVHERTMYAPIWQFAFINGHGPRVGESGFGLIPRFAYTGPYEDITIKSYTASSLKSVVPFPWPAVPFEGAFPTGKPQDYGSQTGRGLDAAADTRRTAAQPPLQQIERASAGLCAFGGESSLTVASGRRRNRDLKWRERPVLP